MICIKSSTIVVLAFMYMKDEVRSPCFFFVLKRKKAVHLKFTKVEIRFAHVRHSRHDVDQYVSIEFHTPQSNSIDPCTSTICHDG